MQKIYKIDGVGVNLERFHPIRSEEEKILLRKSYGFSPDDFILLISPFIVKSAIISPDTVFIFLSTEKAVNIFSF